MVLEIIKYLKVIFNGDLGAAKIVLKTKTPYYVSNSFWLGMKNDFELHSKDIWIGTTLIQIWKASINVLLCICIQQFNNYCGFF